MEFNSEESRYNQMIEELLQVSANKTSDASERISYLNITFSQKGISEFSGKMCVVFIPREEVVRVESKVGSRAERPLVQGIAGLVLSGLGGYGIYLITQMGIALARWEAGLIVFGAIGVWLLFEALRQGHQLRVTCSKEVRKLIFNGKVDEAEFGEFLRKVRELGYECL